MSTEEPASITVHDGQDAPSPLEAPPPVEIVPDEEVDARKLNKVLERVAVRASEGIRALRLPDVPRDETDAWLLSPSELRDIVPALATGTEAAGMAAGIVTYGPMLVAGIAALTFTTRSVAAERAYRKAHDGDPNNRDAAELAAEPAGLEPGAPVVADGESGLADLARRSRN